MLTKTAFNAMTLLTGASLFGLSSEAKAASYRHVDRLAIQLQRQTETLHHEVHAHFRQLPDFRHLDQDVSDMERLARHIHDVAHRNGSLNHLRSDLNQLDREFHHVQRLVLRMAVTGQLDYQARAHLSRSLRSMGSTLHHLRADVDYLVRHQHHGGFHHGSHGGSVHRGGIQIQRGSRGIMVNRGGIRIQWHR